MIGLVQASASNACPTGIDDQRPIAIPTAAVSNATGASRENAPALGFPCIHRADPYTWPAQKPTSVPQALHYAKRKTKQKQNMPKRIRRSQSD